VLECAARKIAEGHGYDKCLKAWFIRIRIDFLMGCDRGYFVNFQDETGGMERGLKEG
jgi:hypothetical protein